MGRWWWHRRQYEDLSVSIEEHIAEHVDELMAEGMPRREAEMAARRAFGNLTLVRERSREVWQWGGAERLATDLKLILRRLRKAPGFAVTVLLTLAIGIGANTAVFSVVNSVLLKGLPYPDADRLVALRLKAPGAPGMSSLATGLALSPSMYTTFAEHNRSFASLGVWTTQTSNVTGIGHPEEVQTALVSGGVLESLGVPPVAGRWLNASDQDPHGQQPVMLSYEYWRKRFGQDRGAVERSIVLDGQTRQIVGVMPRGFTLMDTKFDVLGPLAFDRSKMKLAPFGFSGLGRLKQGVKLAQADADFERLLGLWMDSWSNGPGSNPHYYEVWMIKADFQPLKQAVVGDVGRVLWVVMATIGLVMLIACMNVANLLLVRADARQQELAVRAALGAGRARIAREMLLESVVLGLMGGALGVGVALAGLRLLVRFGPQDLPRMTEIGLDGWGLGFTVLISVVSGIVFGTAPIWKHVQARRVVSTGNRTASMSRERNRSRDVLVVGQVAMALVLLVGASLMIRTFIQLHDVEPGIADARHVQTMGISMPETMVADPVMVTRMENEIADRLAEIPGVSSVGFAQAVPMDGNQPNSDEIRIEGKNYEGGVPPILFFNYLSPGYFHTVGTRFVAGRDFDWTDLYGMQNHVIISENFARESWGSAQAAIGKRLRMWGGLPWQGVVGVVEDVRQVSVDTAAPAIVYWPAMINSPYTKGTIYASRAVTFVLKSDRAGSAEMLERMQNAVWGVNGDLPLQSVATLDDVYRHSMARTSFTLVMLAIAGAMALLLGVIGIYGVISYAVSQRTREIGIRMALGAQKGELRWMFVRSALVLTGAGVGIGLGAAAGLVRLMKSLLFGVNPMDPVSFVAIPLVLVAATVLASYLPARRAAAVDPVEALRAE
jgi:predicted permease